MTQPKGSLATGSLADQVRRSDPDRFLAALFAPAERRETLFILFAFNHELARAREVASQPMLALIRLQWWREVVLGARKRHDVAESLRDAIERGALRAEDLLAMIAAREAEADDGIPDQAAWNAYLEGTAGGVAVAAGRALGAPDDILHRLRDLGAAYGVAGQIGNVAALARHERCMLPADLLGIHGLTPWDVLQRPESAAPALAELAAQGLARIARSGGLLPRPLISAALPAVLARRDLRRGSRHRGAGDKLAVTMAALRANIP